ncbi:MAG: LamG domain-containing protein [Verrucomicrobiota bacterium]
MKKERAGLGKIAKPSKGILYALLGFASIVIVLGLLHAQTFLNGGQSRPPDSFVQVAAESQGLAQVAPEDLPRGGTYWWVMPNGCAVPTPFLPRDLNGPVYQITDAQFLVDTTGGQVVLNSRQFGLRRQTTANTVATIVAAQADVVVNLINQIQTREYARQVRAMALAMGIPMPGGGGDSGGGGDGGGVLPSGSAYTFDKSGLWLGNPTVSNGVSSVNLNNATNQVYAILTTTNLLGSWQVEAVVWPTNNAVMPFTVQNADRPILFFRAKDWTGVTENGNITPDWWLWQYFNTTALSDTNLDINGNTLVYDYTNHLDPNNGRIGYWSFDDTNIWVGDAGQLPLVATNVVGVSSWSTNAVLIDATNAVVLEYRTVETNGNPNLLLPKGSLRFWFKPDWNSGTGPGTAGRLIEVGYQTATNGWWALVFNTNGTQLTFNTQSGGLAMTNLSASINWASNQWHQIVLTYIGTNSSLYLDGQPATNGTGSVYYPNAVERAGGFRLGSDVNGANQARGAFDELETFSYPLDPASISANYGVAINLDNNGDGMGDIWEMDYFGTLSVNPNGNPAGDGYANLQKYQLGLNPNINYNNSPSLRSNYGYTPADWLNGVTGIKTGTVSLDAEGNVTTVSQ